MAAGRLGYWDARKLRFLKISAESGLSFLSFLRKLRKYPKNPACPIKFEDHLIGVNPV
jgi:hypothetical protein